MDRNNPTVSWLLHSHDPSIRYFALTEVLDEPEDSREAEVAIRGIVRGPRGKGSLSARLAGWAENPSGPQGCGESDGRGLAMAYWRVPGVSEGPAEERALE